MNALGQLSRVIVTPLSYNDALEIAEETMAVSVPRPDGSQPFPSGFVAMRHRIACALMAVDRASRDQAPEVLTLMGEWLLDGDYTPMPPRGSL